MLKSVLEEQLGVQHEDTSSVTAWQQPRVALGGRKCVTVHIFNGLARTAQVERRIVEELRGQGLVAVPGQPRPRLPTYDDVEALPFLRAVINVRLFCGRVKLHVSWCPSWSQAREAVSLGAMKKQTHFLLRPCLTFPAS